MKGLFKNLNFREMGKRLWHALTGHLWLKLLSLLFAIILWIYIIDSTPSLTRSKHMSGLSISVPERVRSRARDRRVFRISG